MFFSQWWWLCPIMSYPFFINPPSSQRMYVRLILSKAWKPPPPYKKTNFKAHKKITFLLEDIRGMVRTFLATTIGGVRLTNHFAPRLCLDRFILALPPTTISAQAIATSFAGVLRTVSGELRVGWWWPLKDLDGNISNDEMKWCCSNILANLWTIWVGLKTCVRCRPGKGDRTSRWWFHISFFTLKPAGSCRCMIQFKSS